MRRRVNAGIVGLALASAGCNIAASAEAGLDCAATENCPEAQVCFFGKCVDPGYNITSVYFDLTPPDSSGLLPQVDSSSPRDLSNTGARQDVTLRGPVLISGRLATSTGEPRSGVLLAKPVLGPDAVHLPSVLLPVRAVVSGTFVLSSMPGAYSLRFEPDPNTPARPPLTLYTEDWPLSAEGAAAGLTLVYPNDPEMTTMTGQVTVDRTEPTFIGGVRVRGTASGPGGATLESSSSITSDQDGLYSIVFPPGAAPPYRLFVSPDANDNVPSASGIVTVRTSPQGGMPGEFHPLPLEIPTGIQLDAVVSNNGTSIANANLLFEGAVGIGVYTTTGVTDVFGRASAIPLYHGEYTVTVAPPRAQPFALTTKTFCVGSEPPGGCSGDLISAGTPLRLQVGNKLRLSGAVVDHSGQPVPGARLSARPFNADTLAREFSTTTRADGSYTLEVDPAAAGGTSQYEVVIEPQQTGDAPLPRHRQIIDVGGGDTQEQSFFLYRATLVHGRVRDPQGRALAGVRVAIYATTEPLGTPAAPLLVGLAQSSQGGEFVVPIPTLD